MTNRHQGPLTPREKAVMDALTELGNPGLVASKIGISYRSVVQALFLARKKLGVDNNVRAALRWGPKLTPESLPASVRELARVLGDNDALRLLGAFGGARLPGLMRMKEDHAFRVFLGEEGFAKLLAHYGSETPDLPKCDGYLRELRHELVRQCRAQGMTIDETAEETGYTRRHVINIMGGEAGGGDTQTRDMFAQDEDAAVGQRRTANDPFGWWNRPGQEE